MAEIFLGATETGDRQTLLLSRANRHGLVAGATGTGKTVTLQTMAEQFSANGVPVFLADVKGDLSGICMAGSHDFKHADSLEARALQLGIVPYEYHDTRRYSGICMARRVTRSAPRFRKWARCCSRACSG